jgi:hypothetical protein
MRHIPLRLILVVPFLLQIVAFVGLTGWLSLRHGEEAINDLAEQLRSEITARIVDKLQDRLNTAPLVTRLNVDAIASGTINLDNPRQLEDHLMRQLSQFSSLSNITIATEKPNYISIGYDQVNHKLHYNIMNLNYIINQ